MSVSIYLLLNNEQDIKVQPCYVCVGNFTEDIPICIFNIPLVLFLKHLDSSENLFQKIPSELKGSCSACQGPGSVSPDLGCYFLAAS